MKRTVTAIICTLIFAMSLAACGKANESEDVGDNVQIPAPWTDYATVAEAEEDAGFDINAPESIDGYSFDFARAFDDGMLELFYTGENVDGISIRKAEGDGDISGDYTEYEQTGVVDAGGVDVTVKGDGEGIHLALWSDGGYTYSISVSGAAAVADDIVELVSGICG